MVAMPLALIVELATMLSVSVPILVNTAPCPGHWVVELATAVVELATVDVYS